MQVTRDGVVLNIDPGFAEKIRSASGQPIELCYQCQKCAAGCLPMGDFNGISPNHLLRMINLGVKEAVFESSAIWLCTGCETCGARCPNGIRISEVMDSVREAAWLENATAAGGRTPIFHSMFLDDLRSRGRVSESFLLAKYKIRTGQLLSDLDLGLKLFLRGKLPLVPKGIKEKQNIKRIFQRALEKTGKKHGGQREGR